ncbi:MAG: protein-L-isoaspartate(D-aspartate) O-methyltransferase [Leptospiraceae bacterium]|nr:protein-L-isoaspartate(D-aspartate) O-methyltransferase [Leptospiraceae bacterium]MDW7975979.1 protein-L-isoaspartate(D-aspartate) O-methyltransferase [Leptospiraceae bacterium]
MSNYFNSLSYNKNALEDMIRNQIVYRGITNSRILDAIRKFPREFFVREKDKNYAYTDGPLNIGYNQTISQPYVVALMTELLELTGEEKVLEIGTGSGYQTALLSDLAKEVYTIEIHPNLLEFAKNNLKRFQVKNVHFFCKNGWEGLEEHAPFDRIISTAAPKKIPEHWKRQLKVSGIMVVPVGIVYQDLLKIKKTSKTSFIEEKIISVRFVPLLKEEE